jgi:hypothetical protein
MTNKPRALFGRKFNSLSELKDATCHAKKDGQQGSFYDVTKEVFLNNEEFNEFTQDLFKEQPWIERSDGGSNKKGETRCIRVINTETDERVLINSEGYDYCRYTAIEEVNHVS